MGRNENGVYYQHCENVRSTGMFGFLLSCVIVIAAISACGLMAEKRPLGFSL